MKYRVGWVLLILAGWALPAQAEHATIDLRLMRRDVETGVTRDDVHASADRDPPAGGLNERPVFKVKANDPLVLQFFYTNTHPHADLPDVTVSYFVVREEKIAQKAVPELREGVVTQGHFTVNFKPNGKVGARLVFTIKEPGIYLLRVQSANTNSDHEHFSAIDIQVE